PCRPVENPIVICHDGGGRVATISAPAKDVKGGYVLRSAKRRNRQYGHRHDGNVEKASEHRRVRSGIGFRSGCHGQTPLPFGRRSSGKCFGTGHATVSFCPNTSTATETTEAERDATETASPRWLIGHEAVARSNLGMAAVCPIGSEDLYPLRLELDVSGVQSAAEFTREDGS